MTFAKKILIVEDERPLLQILNTVFKKNGYEVVMAVNGKEGLRAVQESRPSLVLLDLVMPVMDGFAMLKEMRKDEKLKDLPVVFLTNLGANEQMEGLRKADLKVLDFLPKGGVSLDELVKKIDNFLL